MNELKVTFAGQTQSFAPGQTVRIGRSPDNAIVVPDPVVSREHAQISWQPNGWLLDDLGKGRTYVGGLQVGSVEVQQPLDVHLASPLGPALRIEIAPADQPDETRNASAIRRSRLWRGGSSPAHSSPAHHAPPGHHATAAHHPLPAQHARPDAPDGDFATAVHILIPVRSWLKDPGWKQGARLLAIAYGLLPSIFVVLLSSTRNVSAPGWAYSLAIAPLWAVVFWLLIRPGRITRLIAWLAVAIVAAVMVLLPVMTIPWERALDHTGDLRNPLPWIYGVGFAEEVTKALPVLIAAMLLRSVWKTTLDVRVWMFLGTISGLAFGVRESVLYTTADLMTNNQAQAGDTIQLILTFALRVFVDGFQHAVWAGISAFFIGMGVNYRRRRIPLILFGITLPAVLHGLNDWSTLLASHWLWIAMEALSLLLFIGYTMSAATIERQVRDTPLFRGESMIMDRTVLADDQAG
ncbi:MAG TPA: PrsW family glutamic-type intramembrane protease [Streptosporangiaceae bacterium]|nr:PrsW family glutamic-type intramembrane protease [Streptosporangiaceae bacterium]